MMSRLFAVFKTALEGSCFLCKYFAKHYAKRYLYGQKKKLLSALYALYETKNCN